MDTRAGNDGWREEGFANVYDVGFSGFDHAVCLPLWPEAVRGTPNSMLRGALFAAIQGKSRRTLKRELLVTQRRIEIRFTGIQLDQSDMDVWEQTIHLARESSLGYRCQFTANSFLGALERSNGKANHEWLKDAFARLGSCLVEITHDEQTYGGSLLEFYRAEKTQRYIVEINPRILTLYAAGWTAIDWQQRLSLKRKPLALWLHGFLSSHANPFPLKVETLMKLSGSNTNGVRFFKRALKRALDDLKIVGAISRYEFNDDLLKLDRIPSASQQRHLDGCER